MAFNKRNWAPISVGMGGSPSFWSYKGTADNDSLITIEAPNYFAGLSSDLLNSEFKTGDFIQVVSRTDEFALLVMAIGNTEIYTARVAPSSGPANINTILITDGIVPTEAQNGYLFYSQTAAFNVNLPDISITTTGTHFYFKNISAGTLTINPFAGQRIDGVVAPRVLTPQQDINVMIVGGQWSIFSDANFVGGGGGGGTVTSVDVSGGSTGLTFVDGPITTAGTITAKGTLAIANGGTGQTTQQGAINTLSDTAGGTPGQVLTRSGGGDALWTDLPAGSGDLFYQSFTPGSVYLPVANSPGNVVQGPSTQVHTHQYRRNATNGVYINFALTNDYQGGDIIIHVWWHQDSITGPGEDVGFAFAYNVAAPGENPIAGIGNVSNFTVIPNSTTVLVKTSITMTAATILAAGDRIAGRLFRDGNNDSYDDDALVSLYEFQEIA